MFLSYQFFGSMKTYFYFTKDLGNFRATSVVLKVAVGDSIEDDTKRALVGEYCRDNGFYFKKVSVTSDRALLNVAKSLFSGCSLPLLRLRMGCAEISELYTLIISGRLDSYLSGINSPNGLCNFLMSIDSSFYFNQKAANKRKTAFSDIRKNLKSAWQRDSIRSLVLFGLILSLFIFSTLLPKWEAMICLY